MYTQTDSAYAIESSPRLLAARRNQAATEAEVEMSTFIDMDIDITYIYT